MGESAMMSNQQSLNVLLGFDDVQILKAIQLGVSDIVAIHFMSGVPIPCIERRMPAYLDMNLIEKTDAGFKITPEAESEIESISD